MLNTLVQQLRARFSDSAAQCGASSSAVENCMTVSTELLQDILEEVRIEYSTYKPLEKIISVRPDYLESKVEFDEEPLAVLAVYARTQKYLEFPSNFYNLRPFYTDYNIDPALDRIKDTYFNYENPDISYSRIGKTLHLHTPIDYPSEIQVHLATLRSWSEIPHEAIPIIMKMALIRLIDRVTTSSEGLLRIPSPTGYFEFDGGRVMQSLRTKLADEVNKALQLNTTGLAQG